MRKGLFLIFGLLYCLILPAQNLVPNPGFETLKTYVGCWSSGTRIDFESRMSDWFLPNEGTTDILTTLTDPSCIIALPQSTYPQTNWFPRGNQLPRTGSYVAGLKPFFDARREYLEVKLLCDLIPGQEYYAEMYVSLAENTNYAQNSIGMYFSDTLVYVNSVSMLSFTPQIVENAIIDDTVNWVRISGTFTATGPSRYLLIGSFETEANMLTSYIGPKSEIDFAYYYIDDVLVKPVDPPVLQVTGDTLLCPGETLSLQASGVSSMQWTKPSGIIIGSGPNLSHEPKSSTRIIAKGEECGWQVEKEIEITVFEEPEPDLGKDTLICSGDMLTLDGGTFPSYLWQDGSTMSFLQITSEGNYSVEVTDTNGCKGTDKIKIGKYKSPKINLGNNLNACNPQGTLDAATGQKSDQYLWQDNSTGATFHYTKAGTYWVTITNMCGEQASDTVEITEVFPKVPNLITPNQDGLNDVLQIQGLQNGKGKLSVYNRYGDLVFTDHSYDNNWNAESLSEEVYFFLFEYPSCENIKGWIQVIR